MENRSILPAGHWHQKENLNSSLVSASHGTPPSPPSRRLGVHQNLCGKTASASDLNRPKGCPTSDVIVLTNKSWRKEGKGLCSELWHLCSQVTAAHHKILFSWKWLNIACWWEEWMFIFYSLRTLFLLYLFCFICVFFSTHEFSHFYFPVLLPILLGSSEWRLSCLPG